MNMTVTVTPVRTRADFESFIALPFALYRNDPYWVAPLIRDERERLRRDCHPFFSHGDAEFFLARRNGEVLGRIAAIRNDLHLATHNDGAGFFGFFECVEDVDVAGQLLNAAESWLACQGLALMRGPMSFSVNDDFGLQVAGFDRTPAIRCAHHQPYYQHLFAQLTLRPVATLWSFEASAGRHTFPERWTRATAMARERLNVQTRGLSLRQLAIDAQSIRVLYEKAFAGQWGFVPLTAQDMDYICRDIGRFGDPELIRFAIMDGEVAACIVAIPDWNHALRHIGGRLFPFGWARLWFHARRITKLRILLMGVVPHLRRMGLDAILYEDLYHIGVAKGYTRSEAALVLDNNHAMRRALEKTGAEVAGQYRIYERSIT